MGYRCTDQEWMALEKVRARYSHMKQAERFYNSGAAVELIDQDQELRCFYTLCSLSPFSFELAAVFRVSSKDV